VSKHYLFKILIAGDGAVGKTSLLRRYVEGKFEDGTSMTVGVDFFLKQVDFNNDIKCALQLWDLGGQERFRFLMENYVMGARGAMLLIDLTRMAKINSILQWVNIVRMHDINLPLLLVGTKIDLEEAIVVDDENILNIKNTFNMFNYIKTSAKTGYNIDQAFEIITKKLLNIT
jgi:small GTP-binding protein